MSEQVPKTVVQERFDRLLALQEGISLERNVALIGQTAELTIERTGSKRDDGRATGRTRTNKLVHVDRADSRPGDVVRARITEARAHYLVGQLA